MAKTLLSMLGWAVGLLILALACWLLGVFLGWPLWKPIALFIGVIIALFILAWLRRQWHAWRLRRRLARPASGTSESTTRLDADWRAGLAALKQSRLSRFGSPLYVLPWFLTLGPEDETRSAMLRRAAGREAITANGDETPALRWWLLPGLVMLDPAPASHAGSIAPSASNWARMLYWMMRSRRREPLNGLVLSFSAEWLIHTSDAALAQTGQDLRKRLDELTRIYNARIPVYIVLGNCESLDGFTAWSQALAQGADKQAMGYVEKDNLASIGEFIEGAFGHIVDRMRDLRILQGIHEHPSYEAFGLPERMGALAKRLDKVLRPAFQATPYAETPLLRGLFLSNRRTRTGEHEADWFSAGLLDDVLPAQRNAWQPLERWRHWRRLLRHSAVAGWLLICIGTGIFLARSAHNATNELRLAANQTTSSTVDFSGGLSTDLHSLHTIRHAIHSLDKRPAWEKHWMPFQRHVTAAQTTLEHSYANAFYKEVLMANLNPLLTDAMGGPRSDEPNATAVALAQNLVRRINLLDARLSGRNLSELPSPGAELTALMSSIHEGLLSPIDGLLLGDMYRDYLSWQTNTNILSDERRALQKALGNMGLSSQPIHWVYTWTALQPQLSPVRLTDFWTIPQTSEQPEVPAAMTLEGKEAIDAFLGELAHASDDPKAWAQRQAEFQQLFMDDGLQRWYAFSDAFLHAPDMIGDATSRRTVLSALMTATGPYRQYMHRLAALGASLPKGTRPEWLIRAAELDTLAGLVHLPEAGKDEPAKAGGSTLTTLQNLKVVQAFGGDVIKALPENNAMRQGFASLSSDQQSLALIQDYLKGIRATAQPLQQGDGTAMATATQIWSFGHDPKVESAPLIDAHTALEKLHSSYGTASDPRTTIIWQLMAGPMNFTLDYAARSAACGLQKQWEANVLGAVNGLTDKQLASTLLFGEGGQVNTFLEGDVQHFVSRDGAHYVAREALSDTVPFNGQFYAFANLAQRQKAAVAGEQLHEQRTQQANTALKDQAKQLDEQIAKLQDVKGNVTINTSPPQTNPEAQLRPESITLTLQCASGPIALENLNFANSQVFPWSMSGCADTELTIRYPGFELRQQWGGASGFIDFLKAYASGQHRYTPADFPDQAETMQQAGIQWLDVSYHQQGQADVLKSFAQADKLNTEAEEVKAKLDVIQETAAQAPESQGGAGPLALPRRIITTCMEPAAEIVSEFIDSTPDSSEVESDRRQPKTLLTPPPPIEPAPPKAKPAAQTADTVAGPYVVQVGIFAHPEKVRDALSKAGYTIADTPITLNGQEYRNIRIGGYPDKQGAQDAAQKIGELLGLKPIVVQVGG